MFQSVIRRPVKGPGFLLEAAGTLPSLAVRTRLAPCCMSVGGMPACRTEGVTASTGSEVNRDGHGRVALKELDIFDLHSGVENQGPARLPHREKGGQGDGL